MAIVRELTTLLNFKNDEAGLKQYNYSIAKAVDTAKTALTAIGTYFGARMAFNGIKDMFTSIVQGVREVNRLGVQFGQLLAPGTDVQATLDEVFRLAQLTGTEFKVMGDRFRSMAIAAREVGVGQDDALKAVENITKSLKVGRQTAEEQAFAFSKINMALRRGELSARTFGELLQEAPIVIRTLGAALGKTEAQLREMAKAGELTSDVLIKALAQGNRLLDEEFAARALTLGDAFNYAWNEVVRIGVEFYKVTNYARYLAQGIIWLTDRIVSFGKRISEWVGGTEKALKLLELAFIVAIGAKTLSMVLSMTAALQALGAAALFASLKFVAIAAAILGIALIIEDFISWTQGKDSLIGRMLGPVENFAKELELLVAPFKALTEMFTGDWSGAWETLKSAMGGVETTTQALLLTISGVAAAFIAWNAISFVAGIIGGVISITASVLGLGTTLTAVTGGLTALNAITFVPLIAGLGLVMTALTPILAGLAVLYAFKPTQVAAGTIDEAHQQQVKVAEELGLPAPTKEEFIESSAPTQEAINAAYDSASQPKKKGLLDRFIPNWMRGNMGSDNAIPPGALAPNQNNTQTITNNVPVTNNINLTAPISELDTINSTVQRLVSQATDQLASETAKSLTNAMPRMEAATG